MNIEQMSCSKNESVILFLLHFMDIICQGANSAASTLIVG